MGGKRPERKQAHRFLQEALDRAWTNSRHNITIKIDSESGTYYSQHGHRPATHHRFQMVEGTPERHTFYKVDLLIETGVSDMGFLVLSTCNKKMVFAYEFDDLLFRTCPICYAKSPIDHKSCRECWWEFEPFNTR